MDNSTMRSELVKWQLRQSMGEELTASSAYHVRAEQARESGDAETAKLYEEIASDEDDHYNQFGHRLRLNYGLD